MSDLPAYVKLTGAWADVGPSAEVQIQHVVNGAPWQPLLDVQISASVHYLAVGGALYTKAPEGTITPIDQDTALMPSYCYTRIFPQVIEGRPSYSTMYVKMPVLIVQTDTHTLAIEFPATVSIGGEQSPLFYQLSGAGGLRFTLGLAPEFTVHDKAPEAYAAWTESELTARRRSLATGHMVSGRVRWYTGRSLEDVIRNYLEGERQHRTFQFDPNFHLRKVTNWLSAVQMPDSGIFLDWKLRDRRGFKAGPFSLPTYNTLTSDLYRLARRRPDDRSLKAMARQSVVPLLDGRASTLDGTGRVWHNSLAIHPLTRRRRFFTHLGTGLGGYPGGQGTVVRTLLERSLAGDPDPTLRNRALEGLRWIMAHQESDARWRRTYRVFPDAASHSEGDWDGESSIGGTAEAALALVLGYQLTEDRAVRRSAERALDWLLAEMEGGIAFAGYLRDSRSTERDGISAVFALQALAAAGSVFDSDTCRKAATTLGYHLATWQRWWHVPSFDTLVFSFGPRIAPCETAWAAESYQILYEQTGDDLWRWLARSAFSAIGVEDQYAGYSEAIYLDDRMGLHPHAFECVYTASAVLRYLLRSGTADEDAALDLRRGRFAQEAWYTWSEVLERGVRRAKRLLAPDGI